MPRYYFGFFNDVEVRDPIGTVLLDEGEAWDYAERLKMDLLLTTGVGAWRIRITDEEGRIIGEVFAEDKRGGQSDHPHRSASG